jgi:hypothetical protein
MIKVSTIATSIVDHDPDPVIRTLIPDISFRKWLFILTFNKFRKTYFSK